VEVGDQVQAGQTLTSLESTSLPQNVILAQAELVSAQKALQDVLIAAVPRAQALQALESAQQALDDFEVNFGLQQAQAAVELAQARDTLDSAEYRWRVQQEGNRASGDTINATEANLVLAEQEVDRAQQEFNRYSGRADDDPVRALALSNLSAARQKRDNILRQLNWLTGSPTAIDQAILDAEVAVAQAQLAGAVQAWESLQDGPDESDRALLEAQVADAEREWERVKDGPTADDIAAAEARVEAAQATLDLAALTAPFGGTITDVQIKSGDQVGPGTFAFRLDDLSSLLVDVDVSEVDINRIQVGQPVELSFDAVLDKEYQGVVKEVGAVGSVIQGTVNFRVTVELLNPDQDVKPGMTAAVNIVVDQLEDVLLVPNRAVRVRDGNRVVFILRSGQAEQVEIKLGASSDLFSEVMDGDVSVGDPIILNPPSEPVFFGPPGAQP
jgi:HlyD family secretion protein